jgi:hypothetical protein
VEVQRLQPREFALDAGSVFVVGDAGSDGAGDGARAPGSATHIG